MDRPPETDDAASPLPPEHTGVSGSRSPFTALRLPLFRYLWLNTFGFALIQATQRFTYVWLVLELGGGPASAGLVAFALGIPVLLLTLFAGVVADRIDRRQLLLWTQLAATLVTGATAVLIWTDTITIGIHAPLTGAAPLKQTSFESGKELYWENGNGGKPVEIYGRQVRVVFRDDQYFPTRGQYGSSWR
jgi:hypothetical protein